MIEIFDRPKFERWLIANHPDVFQNYELSDAAEYLELHEWIERGSHWRLVGEWNKYKKSAQANRSARMGRKNDARHDPGFQR